MYKALLYGALLSLGPLISWAHGADAAAGDNAAATAPSTTQSASDAPADLQPATENAAEPQTKTSIKVLDSARRAASTLKSLPAKAAEAAISTSAKHGATASNRTSSAVNAHGKGCKCRSHRPVLKRFHNRCCV